MKIKETFSRIKYAFKIAFDKVLYENSVNFNQILEQKEKKFDKSVAKYQGIIKEIKKNNQSTFEKLRKKAYNEGYFDGEFNYFNYLKEEFSKKTSVDSEDLEHLLFDIELNKEFKKLKNKDYETDFTKRCFKELEKFENYINSLVSYVKDFDKKTIETVKKGICNGLVNYFLVAANLKKFDNYAILDNSYLCKFREKYYRKIITAKSLNRNAEGIIVPTMVLNEYYNWINSVNKNAPRVKKMVKNDIIQLLTNPKLILIPPFKTLEFIKEEVLEKFQEINEDGTVHYHRADLEIYEFYRRFGEQFSNISLLSSDFGLNNEIEQLSKSFRKEHELSIYFNLEH
ncbi:MAG: hypothetical protein WC393_03565 [Candidatus Nanoarchaeia archaeon]|jgi:hypothetical protein